MTIILNNGVANALGINIPDPSPSIISLPSNGGFDATKFKAYFPFDVWKDGSGRVLTNFDWRKVAPNTAFTASNAITYYVNATGGSDVNSGLTWALAKATINGAITAGNTAAVPYIVYVAAGTYALAASFGGASGAVIPSQTCAFIAVGGRVVSSMCNTTAWALDTGTTYTYASTKGQRCFDLLNLDTYGNYNELTFASSLANCRATQGTWYTDGTNVYANRSDGAVVTTSNTRVMINVNGGPRCTSSGNMYIEGFDFEGGGDGTFLCQNNLTGRMVFNNCTFKYSANADPFSDVGLLIGYDVDMVVAQNCTFAKAQNDGFTSHVRLASADPTKVPFMISINNYGIYFGSSFTGRQTITGSNSRSSNALTIHDSCRGVSINDSFHYCQGWTVAPVLGSQLWNVGASHSDSIGDIAQGGTAYPADFGTNQNTPANTGNWIDSCISQSGSSSASPYYSLYTDTGGAAGATNYYKNCIFKGALGANSLTY